MRKMTQGEMMVWAAEFSRVSAIASGSAAAQAATALVLSLRAVQFQYHRDHEGTDTDDALRQMTGEW